jgi:DNA-binding NarL/FixJ family response regulator
MCGTVQPDVAVLEILMPLLNGIDATHDILKVSPKTRIVILTMYSEECYLLACLRAGVAGYVLKSNAAQTLVEAIRAARHNQKTYITPALSQVPVQADEAKGEAPSDPLSFRQREVLKLIAEGKNIKEIAAILGISTRTAESHRARVMEKLDIHHVAGLVRYAVQHRLTDALSSNA